MGERAGSQPTEGATNTAGDGLGQGPVDAELEEEEFDPIAFFLLGAPSGDE